MTSRKISVGLSRLLRYEKVRFGVVGIINTCIDFATLFLLVGLFSIAPVWANVVSTSVALFTSYLLNKKAVFGNDGAANVKQVVSFVIVTLVGLWVLQGIIIAVVSPWLQGVMSKGIALFVAKLIASFFSMIWNYYWYSKVIFKKVPDETE